MKVRILCRISYDRPAPYDAGEVCDFSAESARYLISHGLAEPVEDKREVPPAPEPLALATPEATAPEATAIDTSSSEHAVVPPARRRG